jgi:CheY-like chemotaxis protein
MTGVTVDVTQRRKLEDNLRQLAADLSEADRKKNEFLAMLAHELRNPLAPIRNSLQVMRLAEDDPVVARPCRELIERQVQQLVRLVDDLLDVSRFTQGKVDLRKEWIDLREVVRSAVETSRPLIEAAGHTLTVELAPGPLVLQADPTRLAQIISNLLNNAAKYTDRDGRISLTAGPEGDEVVVRVRDTGVGISADMLPRIFDLFTQVDGSSQRAQGGLGIGLTLVRRLVALHGGSVQAFSAGRGRGSEFVVRLRADPPEPTTPAKSAPAGADAKTASALRILIVDDNEDSADSLSTLMRLSGNEVRTATDGLAALATARDFSPNVVLLDIGLPGISGYEVAERLREQFDRSRLLLVAMTGYGQDDDRRRSREAGFDAHLVKPIDLDSLRAVLAHPEFHHSAEVTDGSRGTGWRGRSV